MIDGDAEWERLFADPRSPLLLDKLMEEAMLQVSNTATANDTIRTELAKRWGCRNGEHIFLYSGSTLFPRDPVPGAPCMCGAKRYGDDTTWTERDERLRDIRGRGVDDMPEPESAQPWQEHMMEQVAALVAWRHEQRAEIATLKRQCKQLRNELVGLREKMAEYEADS